MPKQGLFGQDVAKVVKRKPGKVSAPKKTIAFDSGMCGRTMGDGVCILPPAPGQCYPVPYGHDRHAFVTPCKAHAVEVVLLVRSVYVSWVESTRESLGQLHEFLTKNYPRVIEKHKERADAKPKR